MNELQAKIIKTLISLSHNVRSTDLAWALSRLDPDDTAILNAALNKLRNQVRKDYAERERRKMPVQVATKCSVPGTGIGQIKQEDHQ